MCNTIHIQKNLADDADRHVLAGIIYDAFQQKYSAAWLGPAAGVRVIADALHPESAFLAYRQGELVGVAGLTTSAGRLLNYRFKALRNAFGLARSAFYYLILNLDNHVRPDELWLSPLAVARHARRQGIGTALLERVEQFAIAQGYLFLSLNVVDTNQGAQALYAKRGFQVIRTFRFGCLTRRAGFGGTRYMRKTLPAG